MSNFEKISIVGNGLSAWMMCAFMAKQLQHTDTKITLYVGVGAEPVADVQSPLPLIKEFFTAIDVTPELLELKGFHPKLGSAYLFDNEKPFFHIWGQYGAPMDITEFHQVVLRCIQLNHPVDLNKLSIGSASILAGRFQKPNQTLGSIYSTYDTSWSFETEAFLQLLKSIAMQLGVTVNEEKVIKLIVDGDECYVCSESGSTYGGGYLINTAQNLIEGDQGIESWFSSLPFEWRSQEKRENTLSKLVNKIKVIDDSSWVCEVSHRNIAIWNIYQFADQDLGQVYVHEKSRAPRYLNFGPAMANIYSPVFSAIDLNLIAIKILLQYFPSPSDGRAVVDEFNEKLTSAFESLRDVTQLCLKFLFEKSNVKSPRIILSDQAKYKIDIFKHRGRYPVLENEFFKAEWQIWLLLGLGVASESVEPMTSFIGDKIIKEYVAMVERSVLKELQSVPLIG